MSESVLPAHARSRLRTPSGNARTGQPWWNPQRASSMPVDRYVRTRSPLPEELLDRTWPGRTIDHAPLWSSVDLRDGNQALANPMDSYRKGMMFELLVRMGFKEIEVGYPSASEVDFDFVRDLVANDRIPDDVTISVFTPARTELIDRTFEAIRGVDRAVVHLCTATACLWRDVVFGMSAPQTQRFAAEAAEHMVRLADAAPGSQLRFEYSPETFNVTEPEFALAVSNTVASMVDACPDRPLILNLPTTVETDSPNVFADQVEWMIRNLANRESIILSVHPHNDRGTAVASAELAIMAGADRVEGTLFGNGERTGNVCLATLALNLISRGVDAQLDFSDIDEVRRAVEFCNQLPVHIRHPYVGDLVYTAFSGTHQDAIAKGLIALDEQAESTSRIPGDLAWAVPYLPIDPKDVGRTYQSVVRVNSQSGKGGIAHVLKRDYDLDLPRGLRMEFARAVQQIAEEHGTELDSRQLWDAFGDEYIQLRSPLLLKEFQKEQENDRIHVAAVMITEDGRETRVVGTGDDSAAALIDGLARGGYFARLESLTDHTVTHSEGMRNVAYAEVTVDGTRAWGVGLDFTPTETVLRSVLSAINRALAQGTGRQSGAP